MLEIPVVDLVRTHSFQEKRSNSRFALPLGVGITLGNRGCPTKILSFLCSFSDFFFFFESMSSPLWTILSPPLQELDFLENFLITII